MHCSLKSLLLFFQSLTSLDLTYNKIDKIGIEHLVETLRINQRLTSLNIRSNSIGSDGMRSLAEVLKTNHVSFIFRLIDRSFS